MRQLKNIILCADDFGLNKGVSQGILKLAHMRRLSAVSCMVNMADFALHAHELGALQNQVQIGLHFNLTEGCFLSTPERRCFRLPELILRTHTRTLNKRSILAELNAQFERFEQVMGCTPAFIDGHQHVHQFPVVRHALFELFQQRSLHHQGVFIRSTYPAVSLSQFRFKSLLLAKTGGRQLHLQLKRLGIAHNPVFSGIYNFSPDLAYRDLFRFWLQNVPANSLIMCHPGEGNEMGDVITNARNNEMQYLMSDECLSDCEELGIVLNGNCLTTSPKS
ncbi:ChbG/HpnK family deacetylase [Legionella worsleiensis]|uniref:Cellobiose phosphorylase n=1 Tax=Legionella worsleiensis TaxID=45076 RepID=A0A0W1AAA1_9GAMM|nr:ChbG/HpnK family deacetylase [Legionella worsleiensis]KTD78271.1 cellobiose phosphorylase [Legionella worsleiensis]STY32608.1 cellobiose phosphorylase [Legionella worsleiensis]